MGDGVQALVMVHSQTYINLFRSSKPPLALQFNLTHLDFISSFNLWRLGIALGEKQRSREIRVSDLFIFFLMRPVYEIQIHSKR